MKKLLLTLALVGSVSGAFAQGTIVYYNRVANSVVAPVYGPETPDPSVSKFGNTSAGFTAGTQTYTGVALAGTGYFVGLWAGTTAENLAFVPGSLDTFRTAGFAGAIDNSGGVITIPGVGEGSSAFLQIRAWDNLGGTLTSWELATAPNGGAPFRGASAVFSSPNLGGQAPPPNMAGLQSFNIYAIPEPSTFVLAGLGAAALMIIRRRK